ncbi:MAG: ribbon-helix-helix domain-containing protein [Candidatus Pacearchaeota archaeon]|jgi:Arc/MetJ-type ribon-helix-helix transcriptional regulator
MKQKISITIDEKQVKIIENLLKDSQFRNRSHVIEHSLRRFLDETKEAK